MVIIFCSLVIRNGSIMRRRLCSPTSVTARSSFGCTQSLAFGGQPFLGVAEWLLGALLFAGYWNKRLGIIGALGSCFAFVATPTIIPFMPDGWAASAGEFPAMTEKVAFLMKDLVLLAVSAYLLRQDVIRASLLKTAASNSSTRIRQDASPTGAVAGASVPVHPVNECLRETRVVLSWILMPQVMTSGSRQPVVNRT
jgi:uncharacterized protein DUF417